MIEVFPISSIYFLYIIVEYKVVVKIRIYLLCYFSSITSKKHETFLADIYLKSTMETP